MSDQKAQIEAERQRLLSLFTAIGQFMFEFSQLEHTVRGALADALALDDAQFDAVVSTYDFAALCNVTMAIFARSVRCKERRSKRDRIHHECVHGPQSEDASASRSRNVVH